MQPLHRESFPNVAALEAMGADLKIGVPGADPPFGESHAQTFRQLREP